MGVEKSDNTCYNLLQLTNRKMSNTVELPLEPS